MRISDWSSDVCSSDLILSGAKRAEDVAPVAISPVGYDTAFNDVMAGESIGRIIYRGKTGMIGGHISFDLQVVESGTPLVFDNVRRKVDIKSLPQEVSLMGTNFTVQSYDRSEEHTSELQSLMRNSYAVFCLKKKI